MSTSDRQTRCGRLFQTRAAATGNARSPIVERAGFTLSGAPLQKKMCGPYYMNPPRLPSPDTHSTVVIINILLRTRAAMHTTIAAAAVWQFEASLSEANCKCVSVTREHWTLWLSMMPARHTKSFPLFPNHCFNISGLLPCCKKWFFVLLWGPLFVGPLFGRTCWTCLNPHLSWQPPTANNQRRWRSRNDAPRTFIYFFV